MCRNGQYECLLHTSTVDRSFPGSRVAACDLFGKIRVRLRERVALDVFPALHPATWSGIAPELSFDGCRGEVVHPNLQAVRDRYCESVYLKAAETLMPAMLAACGWRFLVAQCR